MEAHHDRSEALSRRVNEASRHRHQRLACAALGDDLGSLGSDEEFRRAHDCHDLRWEDTCRTVSGAGAVCARVLLVPGEA
jgi:hypothetical protein